MNLLGRVTVDHVTGVAITDTPRTLKMTEAAVAAWLANARPGDTLEYHRGFLAVDASPITDRMTERDRVELCRIADRVRVAAADGLVHLLQHRHTDDDYSYLAVARHRPRGKQPPRTAGGAVMATSQCFPNLGDAA